MKIKLISHTQNPLETVYSIWNHSRVEQYERTAADLERCVAPCLDEQSIFRKDIVETWTAALRDSLPIMEMIQLVFAVHDCPIALREQMVRHRVGARVGENYGMDIIPEVNQSSWWSQSMRFTTVDEFADKHQYHTPTSIENAAGGRSVLHTAMEAAQQSYRHLLKLGIPPEDARMVIPSGATQTIVWSMNMATLRHITRNRTCWISQADLWHPLITGMVSECVEHIHESCSTLVDPPCIKNDEFHTCPYVLEHDNLLACKGGLPCPLYVHRVNGGLLPEMDERTRWNYNWRSGKFREFWNRNIQTGVRLTVRDGDTVDVGNGTDDVTVGGGACPRDDDRMVFDSESSIGIVENETYLVCNRCNKHFGGSPVTMPSHTCQPKPDDPDEWPTDGFKNIRCDKCDGTGVVERDDKTFGSKRLG